MHLFYFGKLFFKHKSLVINFKTSHKKKFTAYFACEISRHIIARVLVV